MSAIAWIVPGLLSRMIATVRGSPAVAGERPASSSRAIGVTDALLSGR